jgi:uncharacterized protein (DUF2236 family)
MAAHDVHDGCFAPGSMLPRVMLERRVALLAGQRALVIGALNPLNFIGSTRNEAARREPFTRLWHTGVAWEVAFYEPLAVVEAMLRRVKAMHRQAHGVLGEDVGPYPAGTPWAADMPDLMWWTIACFADSVEALHLLLVGPLSDDEQEELWCDGFRRLGLMYGAPEWVLPESHAGYRERFEADLASPMLHLTDEARSFGRSIALEIPMGRPAELTIRHVHNLVLVGSLCPSERAEFGMPWSGWHEALFQATALCVRLGTPHLPRRWTRGRSARAFGWPAAIEKRRLANGEPTPQLPPLKRAGTPRARGRAPVAPGTHDA